jgi:hypothetical protein
LLSTFIKSESLIHADTANNSIIQKWKKEIEDGQILRIEKLHINDNDKDEDYDEHDESDESNKNGYDFLINTNRDENFVISLSTDREEICVWNTLT